VPDDIRADYLDCYDGDRFVESMRYARMYPAELPELAELLPQIATPVTIINGRHDRVVPVARISRRTAAQQPVCDPRCRPLRLGGGAGGVRLDHPRDDHE
jgi:pimeloyl-ACP methyl ester carboxylesterase